MVRRGLYLGKLNLIALVCVWLGCTPKAISYAQLKDAKDADSISREVGSAEEVVCPPCGFLFSKLEPSKNGGKLVQNVKIQERGEPKSGTGFMFSWAGGTLVRTCRYLQSAFGDKSCVVEETSLRASRYDGQDVISNYTLIFEPVLGGDNARCSCDSIERVTIAISRFRKHTLPVSPTCLYAHPNGVDARTLLYPDTHTGSYACSFADGSAVTNYDDLWRCMHEAACPVTDDWHQMAIFRDPRPVAVSAFYHLHRNRKLSFYSGTVEDFVTAVLPTMTQWIAIRHMLFEGIFQAQSTSFWYQDAQEDPKGWHYRWLQTIGLQLPASIVEDMVNAALAGDFGVVGKRRDRHPGVEKHEDQPDQATRKFEDEVSPHLLAFADDALRQWLPHVLLTRLGATLP